MSYENDLVSIITPAYNSENTIKECIESVIKQGYSHWEMIIINDGSKDNTEEIVKQYVKKEPRIKLFSQENSGVATARTKGIEESKGRFIAFLDSDDLWKPTKLEVQIKFMKKNEYAFTFTSYETFNKLGDKSLKLIQVPNSIDYIGYLKNTIIGNLTVILDQKKLGNVRIIHGDLEDVLTWMYYLKNGHLAHGLNEPLAYYRVSKDSVSGSKVKNSIKYFKILKKHQKLPLYKSLWYHANYLFNAIRKRVV